MCTLSVSNVIYHKFSHGTAFYTLNGKNVNVMLESRFFNNVIALLPSRIKKLTAQQTELITTYFMA